MLQRNSVPAAPADAGLRPSVPVPPSRPRRCGDLAGQVEHRPLRAAQQRVLGIRAITVGPPTGVAAEQGAVLQRRATGQDEQAVWRCQRLPQRVPVCVRQQLRRWPDVAVAVPCSRCANCSRRPAHENRPPATAARSGRASLSQRPAAAWLCCRCWPPARRAWRRARPPARPGPGPCKSDRPAAAHRGTPPANASVQTGWSGLRVASMQVAKTRL